MKKLFMPRKYMVTAAVILISAFSLSVWNFQAHQNSLTKGANLHSGLMTCANRLSQTFTAWTLGNISSPYLAAQFWKDSNSCLADVNVALTGMSVNIANFKDTMNRVLTDAHWFHEKLETSIDRRDSSFTTDRDLKSQINLRYSDLDERIGVMWDHFDEAQQMAKEKKSTWLTTSLVSATLLFLLLGYYISTEYRADKLRQKLNEKAKSILVENTFDHVAKIDQIIAETLIANECNHVARLYHDYSEKLLTQSASSLPIDNTHSDELKEIKETPAVEEFQTTLGGLVDSVYESLSTRIFSTGVIVNLQCDDNIAVNGAGEDVQQIVHSILSLGLDKAEKTDDKKLTLRVKSLGNILRISSFINTHCFNSDELEYFSDGNTKVSNVNLAIIKEVISEMDGEIELKNEFSNNDAKAIINISLNKVLVEATAEEIVDSKRLTKVVKGTKKEILKQFEAQV